MKSGMMDKITLIATTSFGLEAIVKRELIALGFKDLRVTPGKVTFEAAVKDIPKVNLWLRCAGRVLLKMGEYKAVTFDELFEQTRALPWDLWITKDGKFTVTGKSVNSTLGSVRACQAIVKKAVVEKLKSAYHTDWFTETGADFTIKIAMLNDTGILTIDTSGSGLNKRGYRVQAGEASLRETLAAAMVQLSFWKEGRLLIDPLCGSGTILIEAAMIGRNIAPGLGRGFASERWPMIRKSYWKRQRKDAKSVINGSPMLEILGYDLDQKNIEACKLNADAAGVAGDIQFQQQDLHKLWIDQQYGIVISNPPYGRKLGDLKEINRLYISINKIFKKKKGWSLYILTADKKFPDYFKRSRPDRVRKLYNGSLEVNLYQYYGEKPATPRTKISKE
jgi:putative N6-adenine-specific DNA methylase